MRELGVPLLLPGVVVAAGAGLAWWARARGRSGDPSLASTGAQSGAQAPETVAAPRARRLAPPAQPQSAPAGSAPLPWQELPPTFVGGTLTQRVKAALDADARTAGLRDLEVHVADRIVYVRGRAPLVAQSAIRDVVAGLPDAPVVDLQISHD